MDPSRLHAQLALVRRSLEALVARPLPQAAAVRRAIVDLDAAQFHLAAPSGLPAVALLGGTGTGKSTLTNRLLEVRDRELTASNFRRTFTAGPVAVARSVDMLASGWLGLPHAVAVDLPARGSEDKLVTVIHAESALLQKVVLVDTPDVDGDQPSHHASADRVFRWADAAVFIVSPEKYQMTELLPYYRLAQRYAVPALFVMNKCEDRGPADDFARQLVAGGVAAPRVFMNPRDDSTFSPPGGMSLADLRDALAQFTLPEAGVRLAGACRRAADVASRVSDQVVEPLRDLRRRTDLAVGALREMRAREAGIDVDPMTRQLRRRMQQRSILYLMGPQRMLERLKGAPAALARLPRSTLDLLRGRPAAPADDAPPSKVELPDFAAIAADEFAVAQERIADVLRANVPAGLDVGDGWRLEQSAASDIVNAELNDLRTWLEKRWNSDPRDTATIIKLVQKLPGANRIAKLSESAPYLVVIACGLHHFAFGGLDLLVIGGFSLATWLGEKLSDEVARRTRQTNRNIDERFADLIRRQTDMAAAWLDRLVPPARELDALAGRLDDLRELAEGAIPARLTDVPG